MIKLLQYMAENNDIAHISTDCNGVFFPVTRFCIESGVVSIDVMGKECHYHVDDIFSIKSDNTGKVIFD